ncbi:hypothetical protein EYZ11_009849 [Aspergillus tanneri]|uniref:Uncharacterized protein n=1 Tax=Aspergillus tanneri TaxID=1220188 RepID=A0A4S3J6V9_9EURO|nr:hypothetical protein EYZ11_009849 [Aspergillus tanneri]
MSRAASQEWTITLIDPS